MANDQLAKYVFQIRDPKSCRTEILHCVFKIEMFRVKHVHSKHCMYMDT